MKEGTDNITISLHVSNKKFIKMKNIFYYGRNRKLNMKL